MRVALWTCACLREMPPLTKCAKTSFTEHVPARHARDEANIDRVVFAEATIKYHVARTAIYSCL